MKVTVIFEFRDDNLPEGNRLEFEIHVPSNTNLEQLENVKIVVPVVEVKTFRVTKR